MHAVHFRNKLVKYFLHFVFVGTTSFCEAAPFPMGGKDGAGWLRLGLNSVPLVSQILRGSGTGQARDNNLFMHRRHILSTLKLSLEF